MDGLYYVFIYYVVVVGIVVIFSFGVGNMDLQSKFGEVSKEVNVEVLSGMEVSDMMESLCDEDVRFGILVKVFMNVKVSFYV